MPGSRREGAQGPQPISDQMPSAVLRAEHRVIVRVIGVLERLVSRSQSGEGFEADALQRCVEFFRLFADACHHAKEEDLLFPMLESRGIPRDGGPIGVMLQEHQLARGHTRDMGEALEAHRRHEPDARQRFHNAAHQYIELLSDHILKEDNILFNMGDRVMTDQDQSTLCSRFCEAGCRSFGGKKREELERIADELEQRWPPA
ncbi:MAG: hemerythrin domain-containing protein [Phycisphaerae bacterium]